jgi:hypothetical protein
MHSAPQTAGLRDYHTHFDDDYQNGALFLSVHGCLDRRLDPPVLQALLVPCMHVLYTLGHWLNSRLGKHDAR